MKKIALYLLPVLIMASCSKEIAFEPEPVEIDEVPAISIIAGRNEGNFVLSESMAESACTKVAPGTGIFDRDIDVSCYETVVLPETRPHIWVGNVVKKNSIADCQYTPVSGQKSPITLSSSLYGVAPRTIDRPSNSAFLSYANSVIDSGTFSQYGEFSYSVEQFTSYNEIKKAFGSDANTNLLFFSSGSSQLDENHQIRHATGIYLKFYQTNFRIFMDEPEDYMSGASASVKENSAYVNSVAFGRLGILAMETNYSAEEAISQVNKIVNVLFVKGSKNLTSDEKVFLNSCEFRLFLVGGEGSGDVACFSGLDAFLANVERGTFTRENPGVPIFCTFNNLSDNSPFNIHFTIKYKKDPVYAKLVAHSPSGGLPSYDRNETYLGDIYVHFYRDEFGTPAIAPKDVKFMIEEKEENIDLRNRGRHYVSTRTHYVRNNAGKTEVLWRIDAPGYIYYPSNNDDYPLRVMGIREDMAFLGPREVYYTYTLLPSPDYRAIGFPISGAIDTQDDVLQDVFLDVIR